jgi:phosphate-selective porin
MRRLLFATLVAALVTACGDTSTTATTEAPPVTTTITAPSVTTTGGPAATTIVTEPTTITLPVDVTVIGGVFDGPDTFEYNLGDQVDIVVQTDVADEIHVHGYDLIFNAEPGVPIVISFEADAQGIFEVELENSELKLFEIQVTP